MNMSSTTPRTGPDLSPGRLPCGWLRALAAVLSLLLSLLAPSPGEARPFRVAQLPNGAVNRCLTCHEGDGGPRNAFGRQLEDEAFLDPAGNVVWGPALAGRDADGDGRSNGVELLDPAGAWTRGAPNPGSVAAVTNPGLADSPAPVSALGPLASLLLGGLLLGAGAARGSRRRS